MKTLRTFPRVIAVIAILAMVFSFASCDLFNLGGALKLESFTVDRSSVKTNYLVGEEIDFSGIKATAKYSDESYNKVYTFDELTITYAEDITATVGDKQVIVSFDDPHLNAKQEAKVSIKVTAEPIIDENDPQLAVQFEKPSTLTSFDSANVDAGKSQYGDASFSGEFAVGEKTYVIGNENAFKLNPLFSIMGDDNKVVELDKFFAVVDIAIEKDGEYVNLTKTAGEGNLVSYYDGETLIATVDTYNGSYQFSLDAEGLKVKISVLPSEEHYIFESFNAVVLEAEIIKAYNVYEAWELALIDNDASDDRGHKLDDDGIWDTFKESKGIKDVNVSSIVIHNDLTLTADDVPEAFFLTTDKDTVYTNTVSGAEETIPAGTKYLRDWSEIYRRVLSPDETFTVEGNFFTIDLSTFPIIASPAVFGLEGDSDDYGSDFSNSTLIKFTTEGAASEENFSDVAINNVNLIGNAARDSKVDEDGALASAGGLIFLKINKNTSLVCDNIIGNSFFITYFPEEGAILTANNVKCYNSYQNAVFVWENSKAYFNDSYLNGSGGPMIICSSPEIGSTKVYTTPTFVANNTVVETHLTGEEIWFTAVNATTVVGQIKALNAALQYAGLGSFVANDANGTMNIEGLIMASGDNAETIIGGYNAQGAIAFDGAGMDRILTETNVNWAYIKQITEGALLASGGTQMPPFFTVYDAAGTAYTIYYNGTTLVDLTGAELGTQESHVAIAAAFTAAENVTLTQGGLSVVFEFYH